MICQDHRGVNPEKEKALLPRIQAGPMAKKYNSGTAIFITPAPLFAGFAGRIDVIQEGAHFRLAFDGLLVILDAQTAADVGHDQAAEGSPRTRSAMDRGLGQIL